MPQPAGCRVLALMGSGETSPTMVAAHKALAARLGSGRPSAVLLETPYGFQENAADISARARAYFARSVGLAVTVLAGTTAAGSPGSATDLAALRAANWVFSGPGSPSYALTQWRDSPVAQTLRDRIGAGEGVTVLASAAAAAIGFAAVPVYEIYKAGTAPRWIEGLDLMGVLGLKVAVIPHYDNTEGGHHDTRFCYLGERRLSVLERKLPADAAILGVDEHTVVVFDLMAGTMQVSGRGGVTVRRAGVSTVLLSGAALALEDLRDLVRHGPEAGPKGLASEPAASATADQPPAALPDIIRSAERSFAAAARDGQASGMVQAILDLEAATAAWAADTDDDQGIRQARAVLRGLVGRLGRAAQEGLPDPRDRLRPVVEPLMTLRAGLRRQGHYAAADAIRDALEAAGLHVQDTAEGTQWGPASARPADDPVTFGPPGRRVLEEPLA